jgi:hypothetical protein
VCVCVCVREIVCNLKVGLRVAALSPYGCMMYEECVARMR